MTGDQSPEATNQPPTSNLQPPLTLVSACLLGIACRFDGGSCPVAWVAELAAQGRAVPICPEVSGGLPTPRLPAEIEGAHAGLDGHAVLDGRSRVVRSDGADLTPAFVAGAEAALDLARRLGIRQAILKANSPSCGAGQIHEGQFAGTLVPGDGVTSALLKRAGLDISKDLR
jgi:uncharacterized protein YbbK (DUF523 family)